MEKWRERERHRVQWDATDGRNGGAERTAWETMLEMERFDCGESEMIQGAIMLVLDLAKAFKRVSLRATYSNFSRMILRVLCGYLERQRKLQFGRLRSGTAPNNHGHPPRLQMELFAAAD